MCSFLIYSSHDQIEIQIEIPEDFSGKTVGSCGIALKHNLITHTGTTDSDFRGGVCVTLINLSSTEYEIDYGERISQMTFEKYETVKFVEVEPDKMFNESGRGSNGFGSSNK